MKKSSDDVQVQTKARKQSVDLLEVPDEDAFWNSGTAWDSEKMKKDVDRAIANADSPLQTQPKDVSSPSASLRPGHAPATDPLHKREKSRIPRSEHRTPEDYETTSMQLRRPTDEKRAAAKAEKSRRKAEKEARKREKSQLPQDDLTDAVYRTPNTGGPVDLFAVARRPEGAAKQWPPKVESEVMAKNSKRSSDVASISDSSTESVSDDSSSEDSVVSSKELAAEVKKAGERSAKRGVAKKKDKKNKKKKAQVQSGEKALSQSL